MVRVSVWFLRVRLREKARVIVKFRARQSVRPRPISRVWVRDRVRFKFPLG
jgi:hypothetical protein